MDKQITEKEKEKLQEHSGGKNIKQITKELLSAYDEDVINEKAQKEIDRMCTDGQTSVSDISPARKEEARKNAQKELILEASKTFNGEFCDYVENVRKQHEQIIDHINLDKVTKSEWDTTSVDKAKEIIQDFTEYLEANKDEIKALSIFYNQPYNRRSITFKMIKEVMDKLKMEKPQLSPLVVWKSYDFLVETDGRPSPREKGRPKDELTTLVSLIRHACGIDQQLKPFDKTINENFQNWIFKQNAGQHNRFTQEQLDWLRMIKNHVVSSYHIEMDDLDYTPFDAQGGKGKMYQLFGDEMNGIIEELNEVLAA